MFSSLENHMKIREQALLWSLGNLVGPVQPIVMHLAILMEKEKPQWMTSNTGRR